VEIPYGEWGILMALSTGIVITATAIGVGNEWIQSGAINFRMAIAGLGASLFLTGIEKLNYTAGVGLSAMVLIGVLLTPFRGNSPAQEVVNLLGAKQATPTAAQGVKSGNLGVA
jgi:hypothetical protein